MGKYVLGIDQSTQGTKALLLSESGKICFRADLPHRQIVNQAGWVEHDAEEIYENTIQVVKNLLKESGTAPSDIVTVGISNQRETVLSWNRETGKPVYHAIVWQCARAAGICERIEDAAELVHEKTGLKLSPYFSAAKVAWILENVPGARELADQGKLCYGTIDSWLLFRLTGGTSFCTDYSNASRTQLFNIHTLTWDEEICGLLGIPMSGLPKVCDSDSCFGETDFEGVFEHPIPIYAMLGDSHAALFGQGCHRSGMCKATYGTGSSVMMNIGETPMISKQVVTSLAWGRSGQVQYVLEGNINYAGAVITWLKDDLQLISSPSETAVLSEQANPEDNTCLVPAFSGLGAPYWKSDTKALLCNMSRTTGKAEIVRAAVQSIAYQVTDILTVMQNESGITLDEIRADGGPTKNAYLMQFQSDIAGIRVQIPAAEELSGMGAAYLAGIAAGFYREEELFSGAFANSYTPSMQDSERERLRTNWNEAVRLVLGS